MDNEVKKEKGKVLLNCFIAAVLAAIITGLCYNSWHSKNDISVSFEAQNERKVDYVVYYTESAEDNFSGEKTVKQVVPAGSHRVEFILPTKNVAHLRLDFGSRPGTVFISDLKIEGNKTLNLNDFDEYRYNKHIDEHEVTESGGLRVISKQNDPYMIITEDFDITQKDIYDWHKTGIIFGASFVMILALLMFLKRKRK